MPRDGVDPPISTPRSRDFYLAYLNSSSWRTVRSRALKLAEYRCVRCSSKRDLQVHHLNYERLGRKWDQDLEVLCANCHEGETIKSTEKSDNGIYLKLASTALRFEPFATVSDLSAAVKDLCAKHKIRYEAHQVDRALELVTGSRLQRITPKVREDGTKPSPQEVNRQEAHEILTRLGVAFGGGLPIKSMPTQRESNLEAVRAARELIQAAKAARYQ